MFLIETKHAAGPEQVGNLCRTFPGAGGECLAHRRPRPGAPRRGRTFALFILVLIRTAWIADDAFINFRTIENFLDGHRLRWNVAERVQTFTDPLWGFVLAAGAAVTREFYYTSLLLSFAFTLAALLVCVRATEDR